MISGLITGLLLALIAILIGKWRTGKFKYQVERYKQTGDAKIVSYSSSRKNDLTDQIENLYRVVITLDDTQEQINNQIIIPDIDDPESLVGSVVRVRYDAKHNNAMIEERWKKDFAGIE